MLTRTILRIDVITMICLLIFLTFFEVTAGFTYAEIFADFGEVYRAGIVSLILFAISALLVSFERSLSAKIIMLLGFAMLVLLVVDVLQFFETYDVHI